MVNELIDAIASKLRAELGEGFTIYREKQEQGINIPCFFIFLRSSGFKRMVGRRYFMEQQFTIEFHPGTDRRMAEIHDILDRLNEILEYVAADGALYRGSKMNCEIIDGVLRFYVNYNFYLYRQNEAVSTMGNVDINSGIKNE